MDRQIRKRMKSLSLIATAAAVLSIGLGSANAQAAPDAGSSLPATAQQGDVQFLSGGVGLDESTAIKHAAPHWPLSLSFIGGQKDFVSDVGVKITDSHGGVALQTSSQGPYMLVRIKPGKYTVAATYAGHEQTHTVTVPATGHASSRFDWKAK